MINLSTLILKGYSFIICLKRPKEPLSEYDKSVLEFEADSLGELVLAGWLKQWLIAWRDYCMLISDLHASLVNFFRLPRCPDRMLRKPVDPEVERLGHVWSLYLKVRKEEYKVPLPISQSVRSSYLTEVSDAET